MVKTSTTGVAALLNPRSIAIVGASARQESLGGRPLVNLRRQGYGGDIYPINPRYDAIGDLRCYPTLNDLPAPPDVMLVLVGADLVASTLDEGASMGARAAIVFGAGYAETGGEGLKRQEQLASYAPRGLRLCGPNCNGIFNLRAKTAMGFSPAFEFPARQGSVALICQSGAVSTGVASRGMEMGVGFSHIVATGNEADLEVSDFIEHLLDDDDVSAFALFIEGLKNPRRFLDVATRALERGKPIVAMKIGRSRSGQRVALSHTGAMTGSYDVITGAMRQRGVILADGLDELIGHAAVLSLPCRPKPGAGLAVASISGGMAALIGDECEEAGVALAEFGAPTRDALAVSLPRGANLANPLDVTGQVVNEPAVWKACLEAASGDAAVDAVLSVFSITAGQIERRFADDLVEIARGADKLHVGVWASSLPAGSGFFSLRDAGLPIFMRSRDAVGALAAWRAYWTTRAKRLDGLRAAGGSHPRPAERQAQGEPSSPWELLRQFDIPVPRQCLVRDAAELDAALGSITFPVALKLQSPDIAHKTEHGAIRLGLRTAEEARSAFRELAGLPAMQGGGPRIEGVLLQEMAAGRRELILGLKQEPGLGPAVMVGLGGIFSEVLRDKSVRLAPLSQFDSEEMLGELRARALLGEVRGLAAVDTGMLSRVLLNFSALAMSHSATLRELDINPLILSDGGGAATAVDVLAVPV